MLKFLLLVNKQGHTRVSQYYEYLELKERTTMEAEITRKCLTRNDGQCPFFEFENFKVIYKRYASLFFIVGVDSEENELAILEFIHNLVETLDRYFSSVCELDRKLHQEVNACVEDLNELWREMVRRGDVDYSRAAVPDEIADIYHRAMLL